MNGVLVREVVTREPGTMPRERGKLGSRDLLLGWNENWTWQFNFSLHYLLATM